jgi:hypothetical protein
MIQPTYSLDKFLKQVAELPVVQEMVKEENKRTNAEILQARVDCIALVKSTELQQDKAQEAVDFAVAALKAAEEKVKPYRDRVIAASHLYADAHRAYQAAAGSLQTAHGESHLASGLHLLGLLRDQCVKQIADLGKGFQNTFFEDGTWRFKRVDPELQAKLDKRKRDLEAIEKAYSAATLLVMAEMTPDEIRAKVSALLFDAGYRPSVILRQA